MNELAKAPDRRATPTRPNRRNLGRTVSVAVLSLVLVCAAPALVVLAAPSSVEAAATALTSKDKPKPKKITVEGDAVLKKGSTTEYTMTGDLLGTYTVDDEIELDSAETLRVTAGHERLDGCLDLNRNGRCGRRDARGQLQYDYIYWYRMAPKTQEFVEGECVHPIVGGTRDFAGARGVIYMHDTVVDGKIVTTYDGYVILNAEPSEGDRPLRPETAKSMSASGSTGQGC
jgi:hypothetical protein